MLVRRLVELAGDTGVVVLHVLYCNPFTRSPLARLAHWLVAPFRDRYRRVPEIQMNAYPLNTLFKLIQDAGVGHIHAELTNHAEHLGALLFSGKANRSSGDERFDGRREATCATGRIVKTNISH